MSFTAIIGPLIINGAFAYFTTDKAPFHFPGIHFLIGAVCVPLGLWLACRAMTPAKNNPGIPLQETATEAAGQAESAR